MALGTYVSERQSEYWTSRKIEDFFMNAGYQILTYPVPTRVERYLPADFIFKVSGLTKVFGFQYKALYHNSLDHWKLNARQHNLLIYFPWIYYALSELKNVSDFRNALHYLRIVRPNFTYTNKLDWGSTFPYSKWGAFYQQLLACKYGHAVSSKDELADLLSPSNIDSDVPDDTVKEVTDIFLINFDAKRMIHFDPKMNPEGQYIE